MDKKQFNATLKKIVAQSDSLAQLIHTAGVYALAQANVHNNITEAISLVEALGSKHDKRRVVAWLVQFGKIGWNKEKGIVFRKRKDIDAQPDAFVQKANEIPYWELTTQPDPKVTYDYLAMLQSIIKRADSVSATDKEVTEKNVTVLEELRAVLAKHAAK